MLGTALQLLGDRLYKLRCKIYLRAEPRAPFALTIQSVVYYSLFLFRPRYIDVWLPPHGYRMSLCKYTVRTTPTIQNFGFSSGYGAAHGRNIYVPLAMRDKFNIYNIMLDMMKWPAARCSLESDNFFRLSNFLCQKRPSHSVTVSIYVSILNQMLLDSINLFLILTFT